MSNLERSLIALGLLAVGLVACGDDDDSEAERRGVGAECAASADCQEAGQECLTEFAGGYCGLAGCTGDVDCPAGSACVTADDGLGNFCFLVCLDKVECNDHRTPENESNCVSSLTFIDDDAGRKVCRPPLSGR
jgi:hypothetical protein